MERRREINWSFGVFGGVFLLAALVSNVVFTVKTAGNSSDAGDLPKMEIFLNGTSLDEIYANGKDIKYEGNELSIRDGDEGQFFAGVQLKGRGNSSWNNAKKPFRVKFSSRVEILGLGKSKKWILLPNNVDDTLMRNDVAFLMNRMLGGDYAMDGKYVELFVDGVDNGVYYVTKAIEIGKDLLGLTDDYGVLVEVDNIYCDAEERTYLTKSGDCLVLKDSVVADNAEVAMSEFAKDFERVEALAEMGHYESLKELIDMDSFAEYFLISEATNNPDAFTTSWWFYRDGSDDLIHIGPAWDFDFALGNRKWGEGEMMTFHDPNRPLVQREAETVNEKWQSAAVSKLMYYLLDIPEFRDNVERIYQERLMNKKDEILDYVRQQQAFLEKSAVEDAKLWYSGDFDKEVEYLIWWIENRFQMMDVEYGNKMPSLVNEKEI